HSRSIIRYSSRVQPNEIQPREGADADAGGNSVASTGAEDIAGTNSVKTDGYAGADSVQTDAYACASSRRQSLSRPPGCELQRQKIPLHGERKGSGADAVPRLGSKEYRRRQHFNVYRYEER